MKVSVPAPRSRRPPHPIPTHALLRPWLLIALLALSLGCPVRLVSAYDAIIDHGTSDVHAKAVTFVTKMVRLSGTPEGSYASNAAFYDDIKGTLAMLKVRAQADEKNEITVKMLQELDDNIERLRQLHEMGKERGLTKPVADPALQAIESTCRSITKFELAKQRGKPVPTN